jgi:putative ABC transport system permease protein
VKAVDISHNRVEEEPMVGDLLNAIRSIRAWRLGAVAAVVTIGIGIGTATSMYSLVRLAVSRNIPDIEDLPSIGRIYAASDRLGIDRTPLILSDVDTLTSLSSFDSIGAYMSGGSGKLAVGDRSVPVSIGEASPQFFTAMRAHTAIGRLPLQSDFQEGAPVAVVTHRLWEANFAGRSIGDAVVKIGGSPRNVIGVLSERFGFPFIGINSDVWIPISPNAPSRSARVSVLARLKSGVSWRVAGEELAARARVQYRDGQWTWKVVTAAQDLRLRSTTSLAMMFTPAFVILLIGSTNVACMLLARGVGREVELSVRSALGATRWRVARQLIVESLVLALAGGALGVALAFGLLRSIAVTLAALRPDAPEVIHSGADLLPLGLSFSIVACVCFGAVPAIRMSRCDISTVLRGASSRPAARFVGYRARDLIVFVELALAVALVVTSAMFVRFFVALQHVAPLFPTDHVILVDHLQPHNAGQTLERISSLPGVSGVTRTSGVPGAATAQSAAPLRTDGGDVTRAAVLHVEPTFFRTLGIPLLRGRSFDSTEHYPDSQAIVVSQTVARQLWRERDPLGQRLTITTATGAERTIVVGVSQDAFETSELRGTGIIAPEVYRPLDLANNIQTLFLVRASGDAHQIVKSITAAAEASRMSPTIRAETLDARFINQEAVFTVRLFAGFGVVSLVLAATGIFGVISHSVSQRTTEFGVRMAVGATPGNVLRMVLTREAALIIAAIGTGTSATLIVTRTAFREMFVIGSSEPSIWIFIAIVCGGTASVSLILATWRIVRLDPWKALRCS